MGEMEKAFDLGENTGNNNIGIGNSGSFNTGSWNSGDHNTGNSNAGDYNTYNGNSGDFNTGGGNAGSWNSGDRNVGNWNSGSRNYGSHNSGDWNTGNYSSGCFNTFDEQKICMFNKPSNWTYRDWLSSYARRVLDRMPSECDVRVIEWSEMSDEEKAAHPEAETTGYYVKKSEITIRERQKWWQWVDFDDGRAKEAVLSLPNFDKAIFEEITGIDVDAEWIDD